MYKLILTDLAHTLLKNDESVSPKTLDIIQKCRSRGCFWL